MKWPEWTSPDGRIRLINADCLEVLPTLAGIDAVVTDPQYGISVQDNFAIGGRGDRKLDESVTWDDERPAREVFAELERLSKLRIIWGANYFNCFGGGHGAIVWDKMQPLPNSSQCEIASVTSYQKVFKYEQRWTNFVNTKQTEHPTEKPVDLFVWTLERFTDRGDIILDPFAGSFTTAIACIRSDRRCIAIEKEERYWRIGIERCKAEYARTALFNEQEAVA